MKKMLFGLIATVMLSVSSHGQTNEEISKIYNENRPVFAKLMVNFTTKLKTSYSKGMTYDTFSTKTASIRELSNDGNIILKKAYTYIQSGATEETIQKNETGYEIAVAYLNYTKTNSKLQFEDYLFGQSNTQAKGFWSSLWQGIKDAVEWVWDHAQEIMETYVQCCNLHICCK